MLKVSNRNSRIKCLKLTICLKLKIIGKRRQMMSSCVFIVDLEHPSNLILVFSIGDFEHVIVCYDIIFTSFLVDTRRRFNVYKRSIRRCRLRIDVLETLKQRRVSIGLCSDFVTSRSCLSIYTKILNFSVY